MDKFCKRTAKTESTSNRFSKKLECHPVIQKIKNHVRNPCARLQTIFTKINQGNEWRVTRQDLRRAIEMVFDFKLCDEEFKDLAALLDPGNTNLIKCMDFLQLFEDPSEESSECDCNINAIQITVAARGESSDKYSDLSGAKLKSKVKHYIHKNILNIEKALLICDPDKSGLISCEQLLDILETYCFPLSEDQFKELISHLQKYSNNLNYKEFMEDFKKVPNEDVNKWVSTVNKLVDCKSRCPPELPMDEVVELLCECVQARKTAMLNDFKSLDICNVGVVCKDDVKNVLDKFSFRFNDKQFQELWKRFPTNKFDQLLYEQFLNEYSTTISSKSVKDCSKVAKDNIEAAVAKIGIVNQRPASQAAQGPTKAKCPRTTCTTGFSRKSAVEMMFAKDPHLKPIYEKMQPAIVRNFRTISFHLRRSAIKDTGIIDFSILLNALIKHGVHLSPDEQFCLLNYFDPRFSGKINYREFLRLFVWYA